MRWLVRNDGIVDLGMWSVLTPAQLFIPLDVHSGNTARAIGLLSRRQNDRRAVFELTEHLRAFKPDDPVIYDFAFFGYAPCREGVAGGAYAACEAFERAVAAVYQAELTEHLRAFKPDDPVIYDFALFGVGVNADKIWPIEEL